MPGAKEVSSVNPKAIATATTFANLQFMTVCSCAPSALPSDDLRCVARARHLPLQLSPFQPLTGEGGVAVNEDDKNPAFAG
jgi:hypothetical protein